jgi:hypothetical protein
LVQATRANLDDGPAQLGHAERNTMGKVIAVLFEHPIPKNPNARHLSKEKAPPLSINNINIKRACVPLEQNSLRRRGFLLCHNNRRLLQIYWNHPNCKEIGRIFSPPAERIFEVLSLIERNNICTVWNYVQYTAASAIQLDDLRPAQQCE